MHYILIMISVCLSAFSQVVLRYGMTRPAMAQALTGTEGALGIAQAIVLSPYVVGGLACYGAGAILWLFVLSKIPVSFAYPFVALGIVLTTAAGALLLREQISVTSMLGICLIVAGIALVALGRT